VLRTILATLVIVLCSSIAAIAQEPVEADLVIRGGTLYDGSGAAPVAGDLAIRGDRIVAVGTFKVAGKPEELDAKGLCVAPGFIDLHNHSDSSITSEKVRGNPNFLRQGCTTIVTGNCGGGVVDVARYFATIEKQGAGTHVVHLMPQGAVRSAVIGSVERPPSAAELDKMRQLVDQGMRDGAFGMSTGLIYVPGTFTDTKELIELAKVVARHGGIYASHIRDEGTGVLAAIEEAMTIGRDAGCPIHVSHLKASGPRAWGLGNDICTFIEKARAAGLKVTADQYPYPASSTSLEAMVISPWVREGGRKQMLARLDDEKTGPKVRQDIEKNLKERGDGSRLQIAAYAKKPDWVGKSIQQIAQECKTSPLEICLEIQRNGGASVIHFGMSEEDVRIISMRPFVATASDGSARLRGSDKPHPRSYGTFPRKIGEFAHRRGYLSVEQAIRSSSGLPADILGLTDRGYLRPGLVADVVVFDLGRLKDPATYQEPHQYATGFKRVFVAGKAAVADDEVTGTLAGRPIRHASRAGSRG
jgi:N-acyl-D-aspartate/D-glutamate deacylase